MFRLAIKVEVCEGVSNLLPPSNDTSRDPMFSRAKHSRLPCDCIRNYAIMQNYTYCNMCILWILKKKCCPVFADVNVFLVVTVLLLLCYCGSNVF